jgi:hypothetical protein
MQWIWFLISYTKRSSDVSCLSNRIQNYSHNYRFQSDTNSSYSNYIFKTLNITWNQLKGMRRIRSTHEQHWPTTSPSSQSSAPLPLSESLAGYTLLSRPQMLVSRLGKLLWGFRSHSDSQPPGLPRVCALTHPHLLMSSHPNPRFLLPQDCQLAGALNFTWPRITLANTTAPLPDPFLTT